MFSQAFKSDLLELITPNDSIYNYCNILSYFDKTKSVEAGFMEFPEDTEIMKKVDFILTEEMNLIEERIRKDVHPSQKINRLRHDMFISYIKENVYVNLTEKVESLPFSNRYDSPDLDMRILESLDRIKMDPDKTFLENIHHNIVINNLIMKSILPCMILGNDDFKKDYDSIYDSSYRFLEFVINHISMQGIEYDELGDSERIPLMIIEELAAERDVELYLATKEDIQNVILLIILNSKSIFCNYLEYMFIENTEIIRKISRNIYPHEHYNITANTFKGSGGEESK